MLCFSVANASLVAVVDSGVDIEHKDLVSQIWTNSVEIDGNDIDEDANGYIDDFYGWNFAAGNAQVYNPEQESLFSSDIEKFFKIQYLLYAYNKGVNLLTAEDITWYQTVLFQDGNVNKEILKNGGMFGTFAHGTHVSGIITKNNPDAEILAVKLLGSSKTLSVRHEKGLKSNSKMTEEDMKAFKKELYSYAQGSAQNYTNFSKYIAGHGARVLNASFGTGYKNVHAMLAESLTEQGATDQQIKELTLYFLDSLLTLAKDSVANAPNTLFVIAAGNDNSAEFKCDLSVYPDSPASLVENNTITVAATWDRNEIADFSCYSATLVQVAAPGVGIQSTAPGDNYVYMNGTSQAAPYVSRVASMIVDENRELSPKEVKDILIGTVDVKSWLQGKVQSSGIVNPARAVQAAQYTLNHSVQEAIALAKQDVLDLPEVDRTANTSKSKRPLLGKAATFVQPLPNPFHIQ